VLGELAADGAANGAGAVDDVPHEVEYSGGLSTDA
jgi:hypothetical protein